MKKLDGYSFTLFSIIFFSLSYRALGIAVTMFDFTITAGYDKQEGLIFKTSAQENQMRKWKEQERKERAERDKKLYGNTEWNRETFDPKKYKFTKCR